MDIPQTADIIIVGGGVIGASLAFHLTQRRAGKVLLLERKYLAAGATGKSSGLVRTHYDNPLEAEFAFKSLPTFHHFDEIVGGDCGFTCTGFVRTVQPHNLPQLKANVAMLQAIGIDTELISGDDLRSMAGYMRTDDITLAAYEPQSGYADPYLTTMGLAQAARRQGAKIIQGVEVTGIEVVSGQVRGVQTGEGSISAGVVVNAAGPWGALVAAKAFTSISRSFTTRWQPSKLPPKFLALT
ncbi:MAG: FAD-binding oxidoreductase [Chloroflexi bacterium]|nr:FAD-binding oxidoreductase [Chloroflexota bacterium]